MNYPKAEEKYYEHYRYVADGGMSPVRVDKFLMQRHTSRCRCGLHPRQWKTSKIKLQSKTQ